VNEERLGYLIAKVEELSEDVKAMKASHETLEKRVEDKFRTAEITFRIFKFIGLAALAVLTFKFGDLPAIYFKFFG
jgi:hypothetical protein